MNEEIRASRPELRARAVSPRIPVPGHPILAVRHPEAEYYRCYGLLRMHFTSGPDLGSGTLIAAGEGVGILTAAHNVYDTAVAGPVERVEFFPARTVDRQPFGVIAASRDRVRIAPGYLRNPVEGGPHDYAVIRLDRDQIPAGVPPLVTMASLGVEEPVNVQVTGYPIAAPEPDPAMYFSRGTTLNDPAQSDVLWYNASTRGGSSGSAVCRMIGQGGSAAPDVAHVNAVHTAFNDDDPDDLYNKGVNLKPGVIAWVAAQLNS